MYADHAVHLALQQYLEPCVNELTLRDGKLHLGGYHYLVEAIEMPEGRPHQVGDVTFQLHATPHVDGPDIRKPAFGVLVASGIKQFYWTSDTTFRPDIGDLFPDAKILFHDCMFFPKYQGTVHSHYSELLTLPAEVRARIVLMHHTRVPEGIDVVVDGFRGAAQRHEVFEIDG